MKKKLVISTLFLAFVFTTSCSSNKTVYEKDSSSTKNNSTTNTSNTSKISSGFTDRKISNNEYEITYRGLKMNKKKVYDMALLRAAEIGKEKGKENFVILSNTSESVKNSNLKYNLSTIKVAYYDDVPAKYGTYYNSYNEYNRVSSKYNVIKK